MKKPSWLLLILLHAFIGGEKVSLPCRHMYPRGQGATSGGTHRGYFLENLVNDLQNHFEEA